MNKNKETDKKVYVVSEYGGEYEDSWEQVLCVCSSKAKAEEIKRVVEDKHNVHGVISKKLYNKLLYDMWAYYEKEGIDYGIDRRDEIKELYTFTKGQYSIEELEKGNEAYYDWEDWLGVRIQEVSYYE